MRSPATRAATALLLLIPFSVYAANDYWTYRYQSIEVTAQGNSAFTVNVARYCARLDALLAQLLNIKTDYRVPTRIYALPLEEVHRLAGGNFSSAYRTSQWTNTVLTDAAPRPDGRPYWGAFFGYTASLLTSDGLVGPDWYGVGVPAVFADTVFEKGHAKIGNVTPAFSYELMTGGKLYPLRTFLGMTQADAEKQGDSQSRLYAAQAWYLARLIFVEGWHRDEFFRYLDRLRQGQREPEAFAASFRVSYEDLDRDMTRLLHEAAHVYILAMPLDPDAAAASAQPVTVPEWHARLAGLYALYEQPAQATRLAQEALRSEPDNQSALRALARAQLEAHDYVQALATAERISVAGSPVDACLDRARVFAGLAQAAGSAGASLPVDAPTLRRRAREDYERVLAADGGNRAARRALAELDAAG
jgi:hypothetical protein